MLRTGRSRILKAISIFVTVVFVLLALSPFVSLLLPEKLARRTYYNLVYQAIADKETYGVRSEKERFLKIFRYVVNHQFLQGTPDNSKPFDSLVSAEAYCDFQSRTLNSLLGAAGIKSRYAMLLDKNGDSPHTLNEVCLKDSCYVTDPALNFIFEDEAGKGLSLERLSIEPGLIYRNKKIIALKAYNQAEYERWSNFFPTVFPMPMPPRYSKVNTAQLHILDHISAAYFKVFKYRFLNLYQDLYLSLKKKGLAPSDYKLFYYARSYHLAYRYDLARASYMKLLKDYPGTKYRDDAVFFLAMLYFDTGNLPQALEYFTLIIQGVSGKWKDAAHFYLGLVYSLMNDKGESLENFSKAPMIKLSAEIVEGLRNR